nr:hypothetical protein [uncultured Pseudomonas sp.]
MKIRKNILYISAILASYALSITLEATADTAPNHLTPTEGLSESTSDYYEKLYITFKEGYGEDSILQTLTTPSLANEFVTGIKKSASGYEAFLIVPQHSIRMLMMYERAKHGDERAKHLVFPKNIPNSYLENSTQTNKQIIPEKLAFRLANIWAQELGKTMPATKNDQRLLLALTLIFSP